jgi:hypothetical protein
MLTSRRIDCLIGESRLSIALFNIDPYILRKHRCELKCWTAQVSTAFAGVRSMLAALAPLLSVASTDPSTKRPTGDDAVLPEGEEDAASAEAKEAATAAAAEAAAREEDRKKLVAFSATMGEFMATAAEGVKQLGQVRVSSACSSQNLRILGLLIIMSS